MDEKIIHKLIKNIKKTFSSSSEEQKKTFEYAFNTEELLALNKENKEKIKNLKQKPIINEEKENHPDKAAVLTIIEEDKNATLEVTEAIANEETNTPTEKPSSQAPSYINLSPEHQQLVMTKWNELSPTKIDQDILTAKDLINHNYTITYADDAARFIHKIRKEYEVVICYLIGFNNEKNGSFNKTTFSDKVDDEWRYLNSYIRVLEKIRNFKK